MRFGIYNVLHRKTPNKTVFQRLDNIFSVCDRGNPHTLLSSAVAFSYNNILRNINKTAGKISGVCSLKSGIGKRFTRTARRNEILKYLKSFAEV